MVSSILVTPGPGRGLIPDVALGMPALHPGLFLRLPVEGGIHKLGGAKGTCGAGMGLWVLGFPALGHCSDSPGHSPSCGINLRGQGWSRAPTAVAQWSCSPPPQPKLLWGVDTDIWAVLGQR